MFPHLELSMLSSLAGVSRLLPGSVEDLDCNADELGFSPTLLRASYRDEGQPDSGKRAQTHTDSFLRMRPA